MNDTEVGAVRERSGYQEPRGPLLPDVLMALSTTAWVFLLLGVARLIWFVREWNLAPSPIGALTFAATVVPAVGAVVIPAALALRHPDAPLKAPWLFVGTVLLAAVEGMRVLSRPLEPIFEQVAPGAPETPFLVPLAILYSAVAGLLGAVAVGAIGRGLSVARRYGDRSSNRPVVALVAGAVMLIAALRLVALGQLGWDQVPLTPVVIVYVGSTALLGILSVAAWGYLTAMAIGGARAGEDPELGWLLAAVGAGMVIGAFAANGALGLVTATPESTTLWQNIGLVISLGFAFGYLAIVAAFLLGLPSLDPVPDEVVSASDGAEVDEREGAEAPSTTGPGAASSPGSAES